MLPAKKIKESLTRLKEKSIVVCIDASMFPAKNKRVIDTSPNFRIIQIKLIIKIMSTVDRCMLTVDSKKSVKKNYEDNELEERSIGLFLSHFW